MEGGLRAIQICEGFTGHERHLPVRNAFRYPVLYVRFDSRLANDVDRVLRRHLKVFSFRPTDYLFKDSANLDLRVREIIESHTGFQPGEITVLTMPRLFGYAFNPVSFWFCRKNGALEGVLCEVNNTFGERHFYWVRPEGTDWTTCEKRFHVSPFLPVEGSYRFRFKDGADRTRVDIDYDSKDNQRVLSTWVDVRTRPVTDVSPLFLLAKYGWITALVVARIHFQAAKLFLKRVRFFKKPAPPDHEVSR